jgi:hypothetical protein
MVLILHENLNALFNIISFQDVFIKTPCVIHVRKKKHEFQKHLQKLEPTRSFGLYFQKSIYILVTFCWINFFPNIYVKNMLSQALVHLNFVSSLIIT